MMAAIIDGMAAARQLRTLVSAEVAAIKGRYGVVPGLATVLVGEDPASEVYVRNKAKQTVVAEATGELPAAAPPQPVRGRRKRADKSADEMLSVETPATGKTRAKKVAKGTGGARGPKQPTTSTAPTPVLDDIADLLQLEEENARLRKALAEKLRAENAELRKRLGLA